MHGTRLRSTRLALLLTEGLLVRVQPGELHRPCGSAETNLRRVRSGLDPDGVSGTRDLLEVFPSSDHHAYPEVVYVLYLGSGIRPPVCRQGCACGLVSTPAVFEMPQQAVVDAHGNLDRQLCG